MNGMESCISTAPSTARTKRTRSGTLKTVPDWQKDVVADIKVSAAATSQPTGSNATAGTATPASGNETYTVQAGDTLSAIAKKFLGSANAYMDIFNANKDQLSDPDKIKPGQVLKIPQHTRTH